MGYPETGHVTEIVPPSTDFTDGMGRTRGGPERENEMEIIARRKGTELKPYGDYEAPFRAEKFSNTAKLGMKG